MKINWRVHITDGVQWAGLPLMIATLLGGLDTHLKLTGLLEPDRYEAYWQLHCRDGLTTSDPLGVGRRCRLPDLEEPPRVPHRSGGEYALQVSRGGVWLKALKDVFVLAVVIGGTTAGGKARQLLQRRAWPLWTLLAVAALAGLRVALQGDVLALLAGVRSWEFLSLAVAGACIGATELLSVLSRPIPALLWIQLGFTVHELLFGLPLNGYLPFFHLPRRMAGTLTKPNTLGVFVVASFAFADAFGKAKRIRWPLFVTCVALVLISGSATGLLALLAWASILAQRRFGGRLRYVAALVSLVVALGAVTHLPQILGRRTVFPGVEARLNSTQMLFQTRGIGTVFFGEGLGRGTNVALNLGGERPRGAGDSTVVSLVVQTGILGAVGFYALLLVAWWRDPLARPFLEVVAICSPTLSVLELFPVNLFLGLVLGRSLWQSPVVSPEDPCA